MVQIYLLPRSNKTCAFMANDKGSPIIRGVIWVSHIPIIFDLNIPYRVNSSCKCVRFSYSISRFICYLNVPYPITPSPQQISSVPVVFFLPGYIVSRKPLMGLIRNLPLLQRCMLKNPSLQLALHNTHKTNYVHFWHKVSG